VGQQCLALGVCARDDLISRRKDQRCCVGFPAFQPSRAEFTAFLVFPFSPQGSFCEALEFLFGASGGCDEVFYVHFPPVSLSWSECTEHGYGSVPRGEFVWRGSPYEIGGWHRGACCILIINLYSVLLQGMDAWVRQSEGPNSPVPGKSAELPLVPKCGDDWCVNGPPGEGCTTYFLCELCAARAPDVASLELSSQKLKALSRKQKQAYNATSFTSKLCFAQT